MAKSIRTLDIKPRTRAMINAIYYSCAAIDLFWMITDIVLLSPYAVPLLMAMLLLVGVLFAVSYKVGYQHYQKKQVQLQTQYDERLTQHPELVMHPASQISSSMKSKYLPTAFYTGLTVSIALITSYYGGLSEILSNLSFLNMANFLWQPTTALICVGLCLVIGIVAGIQMYQAKQEKVEAKAFCQTPIKELCPKNTSLLAFQPVRYKSAMAFEAGHPYSFATQPQLFRVRPLMQHARADHDAVPSQRLRATV